MQFNDTKGRQQTDKTMPYNIYMYVYNLYDSSVQIKFRLNISIFIIVYI